jgi:hypothetical protein
MQHIHPIFSSHTRIPIDKDVDIHTSLGSIRQRTKQLKTLTTASRCTHRCGAERIRQQQDNIILNQVQSSVHTSLCLEITAQDQRKP